MADDATDTTETVDNDGNGETEETNTETESLDRWKADARKWERQAKANTEAARKLVEAERRLAELDTSKSDQEKQIDKARTEAAEEARREALQKANKRILKSEVRAAAASRLADPEDAVRFIDLESFDVSDEGEVDSKAITEAVARLVKDKPYLAADAGVRKYGDANQGARGKPGSGGPSMNDLIRQKAGRA